MSRNVLHLGRRYLGLFTLWAATPAALIGQALPTASRLADLQVGAGFSLGTPDYNPETFYGASAYASLDLRPHLGAEFDFHQIGTSATGGSFQRTYEIGGRYFRTYGALVPYLRAMYGRGEFSYPYGTTELSYNEFSGALGADYKISGFLHARVDYEYQTWISFPNGGLHPQLVTFGVAYHFGRKPGYD